MLLTSSQVFAAAAADWTCQSDKRSVTAAFEASMLGEILVVTQKVGKSNQSLTYFSDVNASNPPGSTMMLQADPNQTDFHELVGSYPSVKAEFVLNTQQRKIYDIGFVFHGRTFLCVRN